MKPQGAHAHEDRLLDFAYGELPPSEAKVVEQHVVGCSRCTEALDGIRGVRTTMSRLSLESAPDAGLDSLLAYAQQSARRAAAGPEPAPRWWRRLLAPAMGVAALGVFGVVVVQVNREVDLSAAPATVQKKAPREPATRTQDNAVAPPEAAPAAPSTPAPMTVPAPAEVSAETGKLHEQMDEKMRDELSKAPMAKTAPQPARRAVQSADWSNAGSGSGGGFPAKKSEAYADKESSNYDGLGTSAPAPSKAKRGALIGKGMPSTAMEEREDSAAQGAVAAADVAAPTEEPLPGESQAAQYAPPSPKQEIVGSASRSGPSKDAMGDDALSASPRAQVASASPPPPPPAPASAPVQYQQPPAAAASGSIARLESMEAKKEDVARKPAAKSAGRTSPSLSDLLRQADVARRSGDREEEVAFLRAALTSGVQGSQLVDVLSRLCDAETALGNRSNAIALCKRVMAVAPGSSEARTAQRRLEGELRSAAEADSEPKAASPAK